MHYDKNTRASQYSPNSDWQKEDVKLGWKKTLSIRKGYVFTLLTALAREAAADLYIYFTRHLICYSCTQIMDGEGVKGIFVSFHSPYLVIPQELIILQLLILAKGSIK